MFSLDNKKTLYSAMFGSYWELLSGSMVCFLVLIIKRVKDTTETADIAFLGHHTQDVALEENVEA